jgi:hypothetical protein
MAQLPRLMGKNGEVTENETLRALRTTLCIAHRLPSRETGTIGPLVLPGASKRLPPLLELDCFIAQVLLPFADGLRRAARP